jgi:4-methyl-5(b-hydroxyethyl)-thiazole monophosphate biosynthesis
MAKVLIPLADGFEDIEAVTLIDVLKRAEIEVVVAGIEKRNVVSAYGKLLLTADTVIEEVDVESLDMIVLPGGLPGAENLANSPKLTQMLQAMDAKGKTIGAICAAPVALKKAGVLKDNYTCYPSFEKQINEAGYTDQESVVVDRNIMTSRGPGTAMVFALEIVKKLKGEATYNALRAGLLVK